MLPVTIRFGVKDLLTLTPGRLVSVAAAGCGLDTPLKVVTPPAGIVLVRFPLTIVVTLTLTTHVALAGKLPPLNANDPTPTTAVTTPPAQVVDVVRGAAT